MSNATTEAGIAQNPLLCVPLVCGNKKLELSDNVHPCTNGEPWGWVKVAGTSLRVATYSGTKEKEMCRNLVDAYNLLLKQTNCVQRDAALRSEGFQPLH